MKKIPSTEDLTRIGESIHDQGFQPNEQAVVDLAALARQTRPQWAVLDAIIDDTQADVVRTRAFSRLAAEWDAIGAELEKFRARFEADLAELLTTWNNHQELRRTGAPVAELARSRFRLDALRPGMGRYRRAVTR